MEKSFREEVREILGMIGKERKGFPPYSLPEAEEAILSLLRTRVMGVIPEEKSSEHVAVGTYTDVKAVGWNSAISTMKENAERLFQ